MGRGKRRVKGRKARPRGPGFLVGLAATSTNGGRRRYVGGCAGTRAAGGGPARCRRAGRPTTAALRTDRRWRWGTCCATCRRTPRTKSTGLVVATTKTVRKNHRTFGGFRLSHINRCYSGGFDRLGCRTVSHADDCQSQHAGYDRDNQVVLILDRHDLTLDVSFYSKVTRFVLSDENGVARSSPWRSRARRQRR